MSLKTTSRWRGPGGVLAAACAVAAMLAIAAPASASLGLTGFDGNALQQDGTPATQAGSHPHTASTVFTLTTVNTPSGTQLATEELKDVFVDLAPGLVGNPLAISRCEDVQLQDFACPLDSQVGVVDILLDGNQAPGGGTSHGNTGLYSLFASPGKAAVLGFNIGSTVIRLNAGIRSGDDYGLVISSINAPGTLPIEGVTTTVWGVPADPSHDNDRGGCAETTLPCALPSPDVANPTPFFTLPTSCIGSDGSPGGPLRVDITVTGWQGGAGSASFFSHDNTLPIPNSIGATGCNALDFSPSLEARPTTNLADSPSGLDVDLHVPQNEDPTGNAEAHLRDSTVTLPEGMTINPSAANGLGACSEAQFGFTGMEGNAVHATPVPAQCPDAAKVGSVLIETPVLDHPVPGAVYIATPHDNPFGSLLALYLTVDDPISGIVVKLAGRVEPNPVTGQLTATFLENPQLPFEDLRLHFFGGAGGSLRTPVTCGVYATTSSLTPWSAPDSGPPATPSDEWAIEQGPGGNCATSTAQLPNTPSFDAGTASPIAGASTPLVVNLRRNDGTQQFSSLTISPPQGLVGKLAGIPYCPDAALAAAAAKSGKEEEASQSCPQASYVGSVTSAAGAGPSPYYAPGKAFLTGPYKGAPLSIAIVTPATAGPFDLGTIVVRTALYVDRRTAQITAVSDPIPSILQGIPLDVRSIQVKMDRPDFTLNPTSCDPMSFGGSLLSTLGNSVALQSRFQVGECGRLGFKPQLSLRLKGGTKRNGYPALTAILEPRAGDANLASISVALPRSEFLAQEHIRTVCTRVQFAVDACPPEAIYGTATVTTPLLDYPLSGPVYLRSSDNPLPDLVPDLRGPANQPIKLESAGRTDSVKGGIRNTFDFVPDAPFTKLVLQMQGGKKGLLVNSRNICKQANRATVKYGAHNGRTFEARPVLKAQCPKASKHRSKRRAARHGAR
jgi:hypothetical protein